MFSLIIAIVAIALVVAIVAMTGYYGGSFTEAEAQAEAARLKSEEQQILGAMDMFQADRKRWPVDVEELVAGRYLATIPEGVKDAQTRSFELVSPAFAQEVSLGWSTPASGQPVIVTSFKVPQAVCRKYNLVSRGDDGILKEPFAALPAQCYGEDKAYRVVVTKPGASLPAALTPLPVVDGGLPTADAGDAWWDTSPKGDVKVPVDYDKGLKPILNLSSAAAEQFGDVQVGQTVKAAARTLANSGAAPAKGLKLAVPSGFNVVDSSCASTLAPGESCAFAVQFTTAAAQAYDGTVTVSTANGVTVSYPVAGQGLDASASLASVQFGKVTYGTQGSKQATLTNTGVGPLTVGSASVSGAGFSLGGDTCPEVLPAGASCDITVRFNATDGAVHAGQVSVVTDGAGELSAALAAEGAQARLELSYPGHTAGVDSVIYGTVAVGASSGPSTFTATNNGNGAASNLAINAPAGWTVTPGACVGTLAAGASCTFQIAFVPQAEQAYAGNLTVTSPTGLASTAYRLAGSGSVLKASLSSLDFGQRETDIPVWGNVYLNNPGVLPITITAPINAASVTGTGFEYAGSDCGAVLQPAASCTIVVKYQPQGSLAASGGVTVYTTAGGKWAPLAGSSRLVDFSYLLAPYGQISVAISKHTAWTGALGQWFSTQWNAAVNMWSGIHYIAKAVPLGGNVPVMAKLRFTVDNHLQNLQVNGVPVWAPYGDFAGVYESGAFQLRPGTNAITWELNNPGDANNASGNPGGWVVEVWSADGGWRIADSWNWRYAGGPQ